MMGAHHPGITLPGYPFERKRCWVARRASLVDSTPSAREDWIYEPRWSERPSLSALAIDLGRLTAAAHKDVPSPDQDPELRRYATVVERMEKDATIHMVRALRALGAEFGPGQRVVLDELVASQGIVPAQRELAARILTLLAEDGVLTALPAVGEYVVRQSPADIAPLTAATDGPEALLLQRGGESLAKVLRGQVDPLEVLFPGGDPTTAAALYAESPGALRANATVRRVLRAVAAQAAPDGLLRVLEIGAGTGGTTVSALAGLPTDRIEYVFTDVGAHFCVAGERRFSADPRVRCQRLDIEQSPARQGLSPHSFHVVLAANVLHATADLATTLRHVRELLAPGGTMVLLEGTAPRRWLDLTFGLTQGWWRFLDREVRGNYPLVSSEVWAQLVRRSGFDGFAVLHPTGQEGVLSRQAVMVAVAEQAAPTAAKDWVLFQDETGVGAALADELCRQGQRPIVVRRGPRFGGEAEAFTLDPREPGDYLRLLRALKQRPLAGLVHLWALDTHGADAEAIADGWGTALRLAQALAQAPLVDSPLWLVTRGAQAVGEGDKVFGVLQAGLWGLGRSLAAELPECRSRLVDLDEQGSAFDAARCLWAQMRDPSADEPLACRQDRAWGLKLVQGKFSRASAPSFDAQASYLITGGLGGLGFALADWMIERGARHLVLLGRRPPRAKHEEKLAAWRERGVQVRVVQADVSSRVGLAEALEAASVSLPGLRGVVHAAGVLDDCLLTRLDEARFHGVLAPKIAGAWNLGSLLEAAGVQLDFFDLFSSAAALIGPAGQANHAAANAFLDALAAHLRVRGLPARSLNWGPWTEVGAAVGHADADRLRAVGVSGIATREGLSTYGRLLGVATPAQVVVAPLDRERLGAAFPHLRGLLGGVALPSPGQDRVSPALAGGTPDERRAALSLHVRATVARILGRRQESIDDEQGFFDMGMDSLMALELRKSLQESLGCTLSSTVAFDCPNAARLTAHLAQSLGLQAEASARPAPDATAASIVDGEPSDDELARLLLAEVNASAMTRQGLQRRARTQEESTLAQDGHND